MDQPKFERMLRLMKMMSGNINYTEEEALMLLNHKYALRFILENPEYLQPLSVSRIEDIHQLLTKGLSVDKGIRRRRVGITGTNYRPLDNEFQIREAKRKAIELRYLVEGKEGKTDISEEKPSKMRENQIFLH